MKNPKVTRPATFATRRNHEVWSRKTGPAIKDFFVKAMPRINFEGVVSDEEWNRLAKSNGTTFPCSQYTPCSALASPSKDTGVVTPFRQIADKESTPAFKMLLLLIERCVVKIF